MNVNTGQTWASTPSPDFISSRAHTMASQGPEAGTADAHNNSSSPVPPSWASSTRTASCSRPTLSPPTAVSLLARFMDVRRIIKVG
ncbi:unnamed protein product [Tilletia laevis]|uniref:Uncharacterized protein n=1 Tax=Tilletia laevis TaxID=157183 RepID=A0A9N8LF95_9BASI|nr:unnamed protein product [Tilletia caries]CAD6915922.1 unnamed protein product [Tilletia laevis]CAD7067073.1 unnamed protein product [Tilletia caries]